MLKARFRSHDAVSPWTAKEKERPLVWLEEAENWQKNVVYFKLTQAKEHVTGQKQNRFISQPETWFASHTHCPQSEQVLEQTEEQWTTDWHQNIYWTKTSTWNKWFLRVTGSTFKTPSEFNNIDMDKNSRIVQSKLIIYWLPWTEVAAVNANKFIRNNRISQHWPTYTSWRLWC